jgi:hypothetical protein
MSIITENRQINNSFQLSFKLHDAVGGEFLDSKLPFPNSLVHGNRNTVYLMWLINGFFGTNKSKEYLNDIIARFLVTYSNFKPQRLAYKQEIIQNDTLHELKEFRGLKSIKSRSYDVSRSENMSHAKDQVFFAIKFYAEQLIIDFGVCQYERLEDFALSNFSHTENSTLKSKCRSIVTWYAENNFKLSTTYKKLTEEEREILKVTRLENIKKITEDKVIKNKALVINATTGTMKDIYIKKNGKWNISKLGKDLNLARNTVMKYLSY